ncbi:MAG: N-formylglutamate deformylase [Arenicellaceae bacterium]|nr:N-formylglutamate deformylase [Arenicellaceae bacterium]
MNINLVDVTQGSCPIILGQPHSGTFVPDEIFTDLNELGRQLSDTDWHVPQLYEGLLDNVTVVKANFSRYVIDPNRDPQGTNLYPGQNSTGLVPFTTFDGEPIWKTEPTADDIQQRLQIYHREYHQLLNEEIARVKSIHGIALVYDCHSIRSEIPYLFDNLLPDLNIGDNSGKSCASEITAGIQNICQNIKSHTHVVNGRFRGGWTTRHYGKPKVGVHAVQMELAQRAYLRSERVPFDYDEKKALSLRSLLSEILHEINTIILEHSSGDSL